MKVGMYSKIIIGIVGILVVGFIGFQVLNVQSPDVEKPQKVIHVVSRRITMLPFVKRIPETVVEEKVTDPPQEEANIKPLEIETTPIPESVPTAEIDDAEIKEFQAWLSSILEGEETTDKIEQKDLTVENDEIDYDYDYDLKLVSTQHGASNPSGRMIFIMELRENGEWRILEWYDYATPDP